MGSNIHRKLMLRTLKKIKNKFSSKEGEGYNLKTSNRIAPLWYLILKLLKRKKKQPGVKKSFDHDPKWRYKTSLQRLKK